MRRIDCRGRQQLRAGESDLVAETAGAGGILLYPTETLYGLGADPWSAAAVERVFRLKGRGPARPLLVLIESAAVLERFAATVPPPWRRLMEAFWPGPLTLLFPSRPEVPAGVRSGAGEVALRVPGSALCRAVLRAAGGALTGTSANPSGAAGGADPGAAIAGLGPGVDLVVDAGTLPARAVSTLVGIDECGAVRVLRRGAVPEREVHEALATGRAVDRPRGAVL